MKAIIKQAAWEQYLSNNKMDGSLPNPGPQTVVCSRYLDPFENTVQLEYNNWYWFSTDIEFVE